LILLSLKNSLSSSLKQASSKNLFQVLDQTLKIKFVNLKFTNFSLLFF